MTDHDHTHAARPADAPPARERPWLLSHNRKIRHLQGITVRNLALTPAPAPRRKHPADDGAVPSTRKSPTKALALREAKGLAHSRSSSDLKAAPPTGQHSNGSVRGPTTPTPAPAKHGRRSSLTKGLKRRTTIEWTNASPLTRQKKLQDITAGRMADTFFTLHVQDQHEPIYISEVAEKAMNPNFKFFDLGPCGPAVTRLEKLSVRLWARCDNMDDWQYLVDYTVQFSSLQYIGKTLGRFRHPLPHNCILFHMTDGIYTSFTHLPVQERGLHELLAPPKEHPDGRRLASSSYDALMRLSTLDDCIQDALATRDRIADDIESILAANRDAICTMDQVPETEESLRTMQAAVAVEKRRLANARRRRDELEANIQYRKEQMRLGQQQQCQVEAQQIEQEAKHNELKIDVDRIDDDVTGQRRRICEDLMRIFPIEPVPGKSLTFTIRNLLLPNSAFEDAKEDVTSAALGYVAHVVNSLSPYFSVTLPYPITVQGSTSTIHDPLAIGLNNKNNIRTYPLYIKGIVPYRFEYGVFLLNKNIEILSNALGLRPVDIRHTLPNLKYLLYVATAGKGELPARKAGGIKGLLMQDGAYSRKGSMDSTRTASSSGTPTSEVRRNLESAGKRIEQSKGASGSVSAFSTLKQKTVVHPNSRLRPLE